MGFRDLHCFNLAILGKQGWRILSNSGSLLSRLFKARYFSRVIPRVLTRLLFEEAFVRPSMLKREFRWRIGDRRTVSAYNHPWLDDDLDFYITSTPLDGMDNLLVCDLLWDDQ
ncbi:RNA-directed DNA polymerase [Gossypium australe]|uniref:RNA-directed DNA polymerase n=1 Tax=Gossypium australe TaxID=47621 RepID=A0A5B6VJ40_9ROSI|nr:RNA-directed DNA polymerase [Gossypium australe]